MAAQCAISGETTENPVVITTTGYTFDKALLDKHTELNGFVCPVTNEAYDPKENVVAVKVRRRKPNINPTPTPSIPPLLLSSLRSLAARRMCWDPGDAWAGASVPRKTLAAF